MTAQLLPKEQRWDRRRQRARELQVRYPFAREVLAFYEKLIDVQEAAFEAALNAAPAPAALAPFCARYVAPRILEVSAAAGPPRLVEHVLRYCDTLDFDETIARWLRGEELPAIERYLARAASAPVLEAMGDAAAQACEGPRDDLHCPSCGGRPQLSFLAASPEDLVTAHRYLECARCSTSWAFSRMTCAFCGENETSKLQVFGEEGTLEAATAGRVMKPQDSGNAARFPHIRIDACTTCSHYLLNVDLSRDGHAVPVVDELAAIPLDLYARERGLSKILPNVMGL